MIANCNSIATLLPSEAIRILGHYLDLTPRFFNFPYVMLSTGNAVEQCEYNQAQCIVVRKDTYPLLDLFFSIQFFDCYEGSRVPAEAMRSKTSPNAQFRTVTGMSKHTWHVTRLALIFAGSSDRRDFRGMVHIDPLDTTTAEGLRKLMTRDEEIPPGDAEEYAGLGQIISEVVYITTFNWGVFLGEAEIHLQVLVCIFCEY